MVPETVSIVDALTPPSIEASGRERETLGVYGRRLPYMHCSFRSMQKLLVRLYDGDEGGKSHE